MTSITVYCDDESHTPKIATVGLLEQWDRAIVNHGLQAWLDGVEPDMMWTLGGKDGRINAINGDEEVKVDLKCRLCGFHLRARSDKITPIVDRLIGAGQVPDGRISLRFLTLCYTR